MIQIIRKWSHSNRNPKDFISVLAEVEFKRDGKRTFCFLLRRDKEATQISSKDYAYGFFTEGEFAEIYLNNDLINWFQDCLLNRIQPYWKSKDA